MIWRDAAGVRPCRDQQFIGEGRRINDQTMITRGHERVVDPGKETLVIMTDLICFPVHQFWRANNGSTKRLTD